VVCSLIRGGKGRGGQVEDAGEPELPADGLDGGVPDASCLAVLLRLRPFVPLECPFFVRGLLAVAWCASSFSTITFFMPMRSGITRWSICPSVSRVCIDSPRQPSIAARVPRETSTVSRSLKA
jgi:hypothetical protein